MTDELKIKNCSLYGKTCHNPLPWICRTWTKRPGTGWNTQASRFKTEDQAVASGRGAERCALCEY